jgi:DNA-binding response OmpR family regulator
LILVEIMLIKQGFTVMTISGWKTGTGHMNSFQPQLVILDINLGDTDGKVICSAIITRFQQYSYYPVFSSILA